MALADLATEPDRIPRCSIGRLLVQLDSDDSDTLEKWLADKTLSGRWIELKLREYGQQVGIQQAGKHRRGDCDCFK